MKQDINEFMSELAAAARELQKEVDEYEGVKHVEVVCECDTVELEHTCNSEEDEVCAACESIGRWDYPTVRSMIE